MTTKRGKATEHDGIYEIDGGWLVRSTIQVEEEGEKRTKESERRLLGKPLKDALVLQEQLERELRRKHRRVTFKHGKVRTIQEASDYWLQKLESKTDDVYDPEDPAPFKHSSLESYEKNLVRFILPYFSHMELADVHPEDIEAWQEWLSRKRKEDGTPYARKTLYGAWNVLGLFFKAVYGYAGLPNPKASVLLQVRGRKSVKRKAMTPADITTFVSGLEDVRELDMRYLIYTEMLTGMRIGEATALRWEDIDWERGTILVSRAQCKGRVGSTKTGMVKECALVPFLRDILLYWKGIQPRSKLSPKEGHGVLFTSRKGTYRDKSAVNKAINRVRIATGLVDLKITNHIFRHTANTTLVFAAGAVVARAQLGHIDPESTETYTTVEPDQKVRGLQPLSNAVAAGRARHRAELESPREAG